MRRFYTYIALAFFTSMSLFGQTKPAKIWATATFNKSKVQVGEPLVVTITVYTSTWFSDPPIFEEIQVKGSMMARLQQRNSATSVSIGRQQYPAIKQKFVIYPNAIGTNTLPSFKVTTNSPPEGGYKGIKREVFTKEKTFTVLAPPEGIDPKSYVAAYSISIREDWNTDFKNLKAGDVLERNISISASGALAAAIPPLQLDSVDFGSVYLKTPSLNNTQNTNSFSGLRTEHITYLLEKEGDFTIPSLELSWLNLRTKEIDKSSLESIDIKVAENPDLNFILTRQKELQAELQASKVQENKVEDPFEMFGLNWWQFTLVILVLLVILSLIFKLIRAFNLKRLKRNEKHLESESHYFEVLKTSIRKGSNTEIIRNFYAWYDRYRERDLGPQLTELIDKLDNPRLKKAIGEDFNSLYTKDENSKLSALKDIVKEIGVYKSRKAQKSHEQGSPSLKPLNP